MKEAFIKKFNTLSDADKGLCKMIFHNTIAYDYDEVEEKGEIVPYIIVLTYIHNLLFNTSINKFKSEI